ncbi:methyl-accepting chemotaxis protein [Methylomonas sp. AM2-LC]|uniref:methyl-accepting chemotaxis protein n=1 Tax=Methylomonas sp. AM2-LC TaxID=3153301 RepID=UPI0032667D42
MSFGSTVIWALQHLNRAFASVEFYGQQKDRIFTHISQPIFNYLASGDLTIVADIQKNLKEIKTEVSDHSGISLNLQPKFIALLTEFEQSTAQELISVGKLPDPQTLLYASEQQQLRHLQTLAEYVDKAQAASQTERLHFLQLITKTQFALNNLAKSRKSFFSSSNAQSLEQINRYLQEINATISALQDLPLLGVMKATTRNDNEFSLGDSPKVEVTEDMAETPRHELTSLLQRYGKELDNALQLTKNKIDSKQKINQQIMNLEQQLLDLQTETTQEYQYFERLCYLIITLFTLLMLIVSILMIFLQRHLSTIISQISTYIDSLAKGDLRLSFLTHSTVTEIKHLKVSLDTLQNYFNTLISRINQESNTLSSYGDNILHVAQNLEIIIADQQQATELAAHQMRQLSSSFKAVASNAAESQTVTSSAQHIVKEGMHEIDQTSQRFESLEQIIDHSASALQSLQNDAKAIEGVLGVIQGFTEQTNLLALNAAIEAARAGEHGRGFAVVADEVRKLATNTATSARQIHSMIERLNQATQTTVSLMNNQQTAIKQTKIAMQQVNQAFSSIQNAISNINDKTILIASAAVQQAESTELITANFNQNADLARETSREAQNNKINASGLAGISGNLRELIVQFKVV